MSALIFVVSSDLDMGQFLVTLLDEAQFRGTTLFRTGAECLSALDNVPDDVSLTVVVDGALSDVAPLNLAAAVRTRCPEAGVIFSVTPASDAIIERAMLAGARAVVERTRVEVDFIPTVKRVSVTAGRRSAGSFGAAAGESKQGSSIVVAGARGGAGRTTISALLGWAAARRSIDTALVDFDLQFGDISFILNASPQSTLVDMVRDLATGAADPRTYGHEVGNGLSIYSPSPMPEQAELVAPRVGQVLRALQDAHELVVVNTGAFWTLFHAELLDSADMCVLVFDQTAAALRATVQVKGLCQKLGIPDARMVFVMNRVASRGIVSPVDAAAALRVPAVLTLPDGGSDVSAFLDAGDIEGLFVSKSTLPPAVDRLLASLYDMLGLKAPLADAPSRKRGLLRG